TKISHPRSTHLCTIRLCGDSSDLCHFTRHHFLSPVVELDLDSRRLLLVSKQSYLWHHLRRVYRGLRDHRRPYRRRYHARPKRGPRGSTCSRPVLFVAARDELSGPIGQLDTKPRSPPLTSLLFPWL